MKEDMYLRIKQVTARTGLSRATIYGMMGIGTFPMKTALGVRAVGWLSSEIARWMLERKTAGKEGKEASPGRKRNRSAAVVTEGRAGEPVSSKVPSQAQQRGAAKSRDESAGWEDDSPPPSAQEMDTIRSRLQLHNRAKPGESGPVEKSSKTLLIQARQPKSSSSYEDKVTSKGVKSK